MASKKEFVERALDISMSDPVARIQQYIDSYRRYKDYDGFDALMMKHMRVTYATARQRPEDDFEARCTFEIEAIPGLCNPLGTMHGGAVSLLADMTTSMSVKPVASKGFWDRGGVTRTLNITMLSPIQKGAELMVECKIKSIGKRSSVTLCEIRDRKTGKLHALAEHGKSALGDQDPGIRRDASTRL